MIDLNRCDMVVVIHEKRAVFRTCFCGFFHRSLSLSLKNLEKDEWHD